MYTSKLFTKQQWREIELIAYLTEHSGTMGCKDKELCKVLDSSILTLQACVANLHFMDDIGGITYEDGYLNIWYHDHCGLQEVYQKTLLESQSLQLLSALFFREFESLEELSEELFISLSTLKRLIARTNIYLRKTFNIEVSTRPVEVTGAEHDIRLFYLKYFSEAYTISEWPFESLLNENNHERLISLMANQTEIMMNFALFQHLKILSGVNLIRYQKGHTVGENKGLSTRFLEVLKDSIEMRDLSCLFLLKFGRPLDEKSLSEMFSNYLNEELEIGRLFQRDININESSYKCGPRKIASWILLLDNMESNLNLSIPNKYELARHLHTTVILGEEDLTANYLLHDYKKAYLGFFYKHHTMIYETFMTSVKDFFDDTDYPYSSSLIDHLLYCLFITWENLFLKISQSRRKAKLLVIERSYGNVGNFLKQYIGGFFEVVNFEELGLLKIDVPFLSLQYDVIVTDVMLGKSNDSEIMFFNQMIPSVVADKLNIFLKHRLGYDVPLRLAEDTELINSDLN